MIPIELLFASVLVIAVPLILGGLVARDQLLDHRLRRLASAAWVCAPALAIATILSPGPISAVLALPWLILTGLLAVGGLAALIRPAQHPRSVRSVAIVATLWFLAFGAVNAMSLAIGFAPLGFAPVIVLLAAVHYHAAGFVLMSGGILAFDRQPSRMSASGVAGVAVGSLVTAAGFVGVPGAAPIGATTVAIGGLLIGWATMSARSLLIGTMARRLTTVGAGALFVSMPLAVVWAVGPTIGVGPIALNVMVRTHGAINALAVTVPLSIGWALDIRTRPG